MGGFCLPWICELVKLFRISFLLLLCVSPSSCLLSKLPPICHKTTQLTASETKTIELIQGKLNVLEDVLQAISHREKENDKLSTARIAKLEQELQKSQENEKLKASTIESINARSNSREDYYSREIKNLQVKCRNKDESCQRYKQKMERLEDAILKKTQQLSHSEKEIELLKERVESKERNIESQAQNFESQLEQQEKTLLMQMEKKFKTRLSQGEEMLERLQQDLDDFSNSEQDYEERIAIAMASVNAAEEREKAAVLKFDEANKKLKQEQFRTSLQRLMLQSLQEEQLKLNADNKRLIIELASAEEEVAQVRERKTQRSLWERFIVFCFAKD